MTLADDIEIPYRTPADPNDPKVGWRGFAPGRTILPAGTIFDSGQRATTCGIILDRDVSVILRDGTTIYVDVYRPVDEGRLPAIVAWSPYGKQSDTWSLDKFPGRMGVDPSMVSGLEKFEGPDPAFWCAHGYAVVHPDTRGAFASEGDMQWHSPTEAQDGYDLVEWIATLDWSDGKVALAGNSWLAAMQWKIAATKPPHLVAIAPWEGFSDLYRDFLVIGGIPRVATAEFILRENAGRNRHEDIVAAVAKYPLVNDYWRSKISDIDAIDVPAYVVGSWTNFTHTRGTLLTAYPRLKPDRTWLRVHNTHEWPDLYIYEQDLLKFFDHVVKGKDNGWEDTPHVRLSILDPGGSDIVNRPEDAFPPKRIVETPFYLDAKDGSLSQTLVDGENVINYDGHDGEAVFDFVVEQELELIGPMKLRLWFETDVAANADIFVYVLKADAAGNPLHAEMIPGLSAKMPVLQSQGALGQLRASHRELDEMKSTPLVPYLKHARELPLQPGNPTLLEMSIGAAGMAWHPGERLRLRISGNDLKPGMVPNQLLLPNPNTGKHRIRTGGRFDSLLLAPVAPIQDGPSPKDSANG